MPGCFKAKDGHGVALVHGPCPCLCAGLLCVFNCMHTAVLNDAIASGELDSCDLGVFRSHCFLLLLPRSIFNKHSQITKKHPTCPPLCLCASCSGGGLYHGDIAMGPDPDGRTPVLFQILLHLPMGASAKLPLPAEIHLFLCRVWKTTKGERWLRESGNVPGLTAVTTKVHPARRRILSYMLEWSIHAWIDRWETKVNK